MTSAGQGLGHFLPSRFIPNSVCITSIVMNCHGLVYIPFEKRVTLWTCPGTNMVTLKDIFEERRNTIFYVCGGVGMDRYWKLCQEEDLAQDK